MVRLSLIIFTEFIHIFPIVVPSGPPRSLSGVAISSNTIFLSWQPPLTPNGRIRAYRINITEQETSRSWQLISQSLVKQITSLHPYYTYSIRVTAVTIAEGPYSTNITIQTEQDGKDIIITVNCLTLITWLYSIRMSCFIFINGAILLHILLCR